ncbi:restriction endonuclease subunit S [Agathobacter rectalis]|mgnify:FL=1|jgi:type I restriction enzyme S subunit|uniref:restriction endonuclease subunit S n=1 Tax=Agathobacter rectalis TaxID=39491 RepID=UPI000E48702B|nr:restriction endonuclease subunit S [Agathobacter rectalis]RHB05666.1 restriction endonuclease subunit S [Agathobacter rectalis]
MEKVKLTDICDFQGGSQPPKEEWSFDEQEGYIRMLQIRDFTQGERVTPEYIKISNTTKMCEANDILIARYGASIGKILTGLAGAYNVAIMRTIPDTSRIKKLYLYYYLKSPYFQNAILNVGSRAAQAGFNKEDLSKLDIECPELIKQDKIIAVLEKLECIIEKRKIELSNLDDLIKARFVEMFGDPVSNPYGYDKVALSDLADIKIGPFGSLLHKEDYIDGGHPLLNPSHIVDGKVSPDDKLTISDEKYEELSAYQLKTGDVVMGRRGEMGRCAVVPEDGFLCGTGSMLIRTKGEVTADYIQKIISFPSFKKTIEDMAVGQTMPNLNVPIVSGFQIIKPPMEVQDRYYAFAEQVNKSKVAVQKALDETQILFDSLMQKYFG